ncbi:conserved hypothetical protein [Aspergillus terreus NIH2624]|uniref:SigF-like NTF2-like domain-containing protein n=1 Tax=Aspergillus terreus (strain NIH 2624 / FGSC A1156) TaxID=341663 RepID=Q0CZE8_ASPTN|nr:uncharacterized protein ATEG_00936 [Aspergillus terreus NIH2624]EAU39582.1 conserved hypothetical protein [Aspergillus terreus NIH2624]
MENPEAEIRDVILNLTQGTPLVQARTIDEYFTSNAVFVHPFCRTWDIEGSRWFVKEIYRWYKIMSPHIEIEVNSVAYDEQHLKIYANISQVFSIWAIPFHSSPVTLTTVLDLVPRTKETPQGVDGQDAQRTLYYITKQEDFYQTSEFVKFLTPSAAVPVYLWQSFATLFCVFGVFVFCLPMTCLGFFLRLLSFFKNMVSTAPGLHDNTENHVDSGNKVTS